MTKVFLCYCTAFRIIIPFHRCDAYFQTYRQMRLMDGVTRQDAGGDCCKGLRSPRSPSLRSSHVLLLLPR
jgi:hypothetical protein